MRKFILGVAIASLASVSLSLPALARQPNADERTRIEQALRADGFVSWKDIELDDDVWEIDDAMRTDNAAGRRQSCDLEISPANYQIVARDCD
ncbi:MAG: PepSY domain-containing protein [Beijerinckiaceae bacterium]|jgi:hypothetical protein|nr:PepSY domain-containing protein [Beijerinckiaceae bacterium]MDO9443461.1 PepSY domain-containing protein [Beijerinckiaceae bacterium]